MFRDDCLRLLAASSRPGGGRDAQKLLRTVSLMMLTENGLELTARGFRRSESRIMFSTLLYSFCHHALRFNSMIADKLNAEIAGAAKIDQPDTLCHIMLVPAASIMTSAARFRDLIFGDFLTRGGVTD